MASGGWSRGPVDVGGRQFRIPPIGRPPAARVRLLLIGAALLVLAFTGYYQVEPDEVGVIQRFGRYVRTTDPDLTSRSPSRWRP